MSMSTSRNLEETTNDPLASAVKQRLFAVYSYVQTDKGLYKTTTRTEIKVRLRRLDMITKPAPRDLCKGRGRLGGPSVTKQSRLFECQERTSNEAHIAARFQLFEQLDRQQHPAMRRSCNNRGLSNIVDTSQSCKCPSSMSSIAFLQGQGVEAQTCTRDRPAKISPSASEDICQGLEASISRTESQPRSPCKFRHARTMST